VKISRSALLFVAAVSIFGNAVAANSRSDSDYRVEAAKKLQQELEAKAEAAREAREALVRKLLAQALRQVRDHCTSPG
jgi:hypothetical protein